MSKSEPVILIVEDDDAVQASYDVILGDDYDLLISETGEKALEILNRRRDIGAVFLDYKLPGMDGLQFMEKFQEKGWDVPVIVVTGKGTEEVAAKFSTHRIFRYIIKPFRTTQIIESAKEAIDDGDQKKEDVFSEGKFDIEKLPFRMQKSIKFIGANFHRNIGIEEIAANVECSRQHLSYLFRCYVGQTPHKLLDEVRMSEAKKLMKTTSHSIKIIAHNCGYQSESLFIQKFKESIGQTPGEFRRNSS